MTWWLVTIVGAVALAAFAIVYIPILQAQSWPGNLSSAERIGLEAASRLVAVQVVAGLFILAGLVLLWLRSKAILESAKGAQASARTAQESAKIAQETAVLVSQAIKTKLSDERFDRFDRAVSDLSGGDSVTRAAAVYALERIAGDRESDHMAVMGVLASYVRMSFAYPQNGEAGPRDTLADILAVVGRRKWVEAEKEHKWWLDLNGVDLRQAGLEGFPLEGANLATCYLRETNLSKAHLSGARLQKACLALADLRGSDLSGADLTNAILRGALLTKANLRRADLSGAELTEARLAGANLRHTNLALVSARSASLEGAYFTGAYMAGANLSEADLRGAVLAGADLTRARLWRADLREANLTRADFSQADLRQADLTGAVLDDAIFSDALVDGAIGMAVQEEQPSADTVEPAAEVADEEAEAVAVADGAEQNPI